MIKALASLLLTAALAAPAAAAVLLSADFEGLPLDADVPTGGAAAGQPYNVIQTQAVVRDAPLSGRCLELQDILDYGTGTVYFDFLNGVEVTSGTVEIAVDLWFHVLQGYEVYVRESHGAASAFASIGFTGGGSVRCTDAAGNAGVIGAYEAGRLHRLRLVFDQDLGTYDVLLDDVLLLDDRAHGITADGVGGVAFATSHDVDLDGTLSIDDLVVTADGTAPAESASFSEVKRAWR